MYPDDPRHSRYAGVRRRVIVVEEPIPVPPALRQVAAFCPHHALPLPMRFDAASLDQQGQVVAVYRCSEPHCDHRQTWTQDPRTGRPRPYQHRQPPRLPRPEDFSY